MIHIAIASVTMQCHIKAHAVDVTRVDNCQLVSVEGIFVGKQTKKKKKIKNTNDKIKGTRIT